MLLVLAMLLSIGALAAPAEEVRPDPYKDVDDTLWSYAYIVDLYEDGILPEGEMLYPTQNETRANFVSYLYAMHLALGGRKENGTQVPFTDISENAPYRTAVLWAKNNGIVNGVSTTEFAPDSYITREHICTILIRYARFAGVKLAQTAQPEQFRDSLSVSGYARSPVAACQMAGIVNGYTNGFFRPANQITRQECAAVIWRMKDAAEHVTSSSNLVCTEENAYDDLYESFLPQYQPPVAAGEEVDLSYFDKVAFVGDSVSLMLQYYCAATKALGNATFLCAGSLSATNALMNVSEQSVHPSYQGQKMLVEDGVAASGVKIVYIMLGINNISYGVENASNDMLRLIDNILAKSPDVQIVIQSVTPMSESSNIVTNKLNNAQISAYNLRMRELCVEHGWYYLNVAEVFTDAQGNLISEYCSDNGSMGIHFTNKAASVWVDYLKTHVPAALCD